MGRLPRRWRSGFCPKACGKPFAVAASGMNCAVAKKAVGQQNKSKPTGLLSGSLFACKIKKSSPKTALSVVRATGLEPARRGHQNLNLARLPIPPRPQRKMESENPLPFVAATEVAFKFHKLYHTCCENVKLL